MPTVRRPANPKRPQPPKRNVPAWLGGPNSGLGGGVTPWSPAQNIPNTSYNAQYYQNQQRQEDGLPVPRPQTAPQPQTAAPPMPAWMQGNNASQYVNAQGGSVVNPQTYVPARPPKFEWKPEDFTTPNWLQEPSLVAQPNPTSLATATSVQGIAPWLIPGPPAGMPPTSGGGYSPFSSRYKWGKGGGGGGGGYSGYSNVPSWLMGLNSWNFGE